MAGRKKLPVLNREISWLHFNGRVLQEAADKQNPLLERLKFLGIFSNNRDEFFRVRVATLNRMLRMKNLKYDTTVNPKTILREIFEIVQVQEKDFMTTYEEIVSELSQHGIYILDENHLTEEQGKFVKRYFQEKVRVVLFPMMISNLKDISSLVDKSIYLAVVLGSQDKSVGPDYALVELPTRTLSRFLIIPSEDDNHYIILLDDVIRYCLSDVFAVFGYDTFSAYTIKITRDAELDFDSDVSKSFLEVVSDSLKQRKRGMPVRFVFDKAIPDELLKVLQKKLDIGKNDPIRGGGRYHNFKDFMNFPHLGHQELQYRPLPPLPHSDFPSNKSILSAVRQKDILLNFPYQSFQYIIDLLRESSIDPKVRSIKMTIYRAAKNSSVINALINAARNGKYVTVFMELQARFDEEANIYWTERLREEGVKVIHGIPGFKVHSKLILIRRKENNRDFFYSLVGTGNFNEETAMVYSDLSLLTANQEICQDVVSSFHMMEASLKPYKFAKLVVSPFTMRNFFIRLLKKEIAYAKKGKEAWAIIKLNSLVDEVIVRQIYSAAAAGVKIRLIIRGICVLIPGIRGMSENIEGISIVDRYLEHARVIVFANGGNPRFYITSADWMVRNFDNRVEVACPVEDKDLQKELMDMLTIQLNDNIKARVIESGNANRYRDGEPEKCRSQLEFYSYLRQKLSS